jgi:hypothetical protein
MMDSEGESDGVVCGRPARRRLTLAPAVSPVRQGDRRFGGRFWALAAKLAESSDEEEMVHSPVPVVGGEPVGQSFETMVRL